MDKLKHFTVENGQGVIRGEAYARAMNELIDAINDINARMTCRLDFIEAVTNDNASTQNENGGNDGHN